MILVTGGAGYLGSILVPELLRLGKKVRVFDYLVFGDNSLNSIKDQIDLVQGDIREFDPRHLEGVEAVIHLAGITNDATAERDPQRCYEINATATEGLALECKKAGISRFLFASTCAVYDHKVLGDDATFHENSPVSPKGPYAVSNGDAEKILLKLAGPDFCPVLFRQGTLHGFSPRMRFDLVVNTFTKDALTTGVLRAHNGGKAWRPIIDVKDLALVYFLALEADEDKIRSQVFNVASENLRVLDIACTVRDVLKELVDKDVLVDLEQKGTPTRSYRVSLEKLKKVLGFEPQYLLKDSTIYTVQKLQEAAIEDFSNPVYYNFRWMTASEEKEKAAVT